MSEIAGRIRGGWSELKEKLINIMPKKLSICKTKTAFSQCVHSAMIRNNLLIYRLETWTLTT